MSDAYRIGAQDQTVTLALQVIAWTLSEPRRAERVLALTGLDPESLRAGLDQPAVLRALLDFVIDHQPDLLACAQALDISPGEIVAARRAIGR